jgi:hypothetical protein
LGGRSAVATERTFPTKTGSCTITDDAIVLSRSGARGAAADVVVGRTVGPLLLRYAGVGLLLLLLAVNALRNTSTLLGLVYLAMSAFFLVGVARSWNNSAAPVIPRAAIRSITAHPPRPLLTRGYFSVRFAEGDRDRRRLIMLPSRVRDARAQFDEVVRLMNESGLVVAAAAPPGAAAGRQGPRSDPPR